MKTTIVSFATPGYVPALVKLKDDCIRLGLPHELRVLVNSFRSWAHGVHHKLDYFTEMLDKHDVIAWLDADCRIRQYPVLFETLEEDGKTDMCFYMPVGKRPETSHLVEAHSGVLWMRNTERTRTFIDVWKSMRQQAKGIDPAFHRAMMRKGTSINWVRLPQCYVKLNWTKWHHGENQDVVIEDKSCVDKDRRRRRRERAKRHRVEEVQ